MSRVIFHIDLNTFFVSAEELLDPNLCGKAVAIAGHSRRSVVSTASYIAREFGISSGESVQSAIKKCPDLIIVSGNYSYYEELSNMFISFIRKYTDKIEVASIDECYIDCTEIIKNYPKPLDLALEMQRNLLHSLKLKSSIGIAPNKFLAKMASEMKKPMGITVLRKQELPAKLWPLPIQKMYGIGAKTSKLLIDMGVLTIGDLANYYEPLKLRPVLGSSTYSVINCAKGNEYSEVIVHSENKSFSQSITFNEDVNDYEEIQNTLNKLASRMSERLSENDMCGKTIHLSIRYDDFSTVTRSETLGYYIHSPQDIFNSVITLYEMHDSGQSKRLLRINLTTLKKRKNVENELCLFK